MSQPTPLPSSRPRIAERVVDDIQKRMHHGAREYGTALQSYNGRRALQDLYEEMLDGAHYVKQRMDEEDFLLREVVGDPDIRKTLSDIYDRTDVVRKNPNRVSKQALEKRYVDDLGVMRMVVEALLVELDVARRTPPEPPPLLEVVGYQYGCADVDGETDFGDDYDQEWVDRWVFDPNSLVEGYYPVYRTLLAQPGWYRVDPERPPVALEQHSTAPVAPAPTAGHGEPS